MSSPTCPTCGAPSVRIAYGFPGPKLVEEVRAGRAVSGGCVLYPDRPIWQCSGPEHHRFGRYDEPLPQAAQPEH